ncbi:MAG: M16 family metallopeptidase [Hyphomicrobiales bacterium]
MNGRIVYKTGAFRALQFVAFGFVLLAMSVAAQAIEIQKVKSPGGIEAWLVEDHSIPLVTMRFAFSGGSASDPKDRQGLAHFLSGMLDEGAGEIVSKDFQKKMSKLAMKMSFDAGRDRFYGTFQTLTKNRDESFALLSLALNNPRFDEEPLQRVGKQIILGLRSEEQEPNKIATRNWMKLAFGDHPYSRSSQGTMEGVSSIKGEDLHALTKRLFTRGGLKVAVVGDVDAETLGKILDDTFGGLPEKLLMKPIEEASVNRTATLRVIERDIPQSVIQFGHTGLKRTDDDFIPAYIMNYILGGGGFGSRLTEEIREKRGLSYSVYSYLSPLDHGAVFIGGAATQNKRAQETIKLIRSELARMAEHGPTEKELEEAKTYLTGSYPLRFDTSRKIAGQLLAIQVDDLGINYIDTRNDKVRAITLEDVKRVAKRLLKPGELIITVVGKPLELKSGPTDG